MISRGPEETAGIGIRIGKAAVPGDVIAFYGDLGAGKTVMVKGIAKGLEIDEMITSPTFTIMQEYDDGRIPLYHFDVYRIDDPDMMEETGFFDVLYGDGITVIEWAEQIEELLPENTTRITINRIADVCGQEEAGQEKDGQEKDGQDDRGQDRSGGVSSDSCREIMMEGPLAERIY